MRNDLKILVVIPARYASTRFPGKPLAKLAGKEVIRWVWEGVQQLQGFDVQTLVATDDERIATAVRSFGGEVVLTSEGCHSGTDRCCEALGTIAEQGGTMVDVVVNVQGDEPFVDAMQLSQLISLFDSEAVDIATLATPIKSSEELLSPNNVKVVVDDSGRALYFSRQPIPYVRGVQEEEWMNHHTYLKHIGLYAYRTSVLMELGKLEPCALEQCESLEQLRWLVSGRSIKVAVTDHSNIGIDTPADLAMAERILEQKKSINHQNTSKK